MNDDLTNQKFCKHGVSESNFISIPKTTFGYLKYFGCLKCIKEQKRKDELEAWRFMGIMMGMGFAILGMMYFWVTVFVYGIQWWTILGAVACTAICCIPMYLEYRETGKLDLKPRFLK